MPNDTAVDIPPILIAISTAEKQAPCRYGLYGLFQPIHSTHKSAFFNNLRNIANNPEDPKNCSQFFEYLHRSKEWGHQQPYDPLVWSNQRLLLQMKEALYPNNDVGCRII